MFLSSSSFSLAIRVKERERVCVKVVFEGGNLIQVTASLSSFQLLIVFPFGFTYLLLCNSFSLYHLTLVVSFTTMSN